MAYAKGIGNPKDAKLVQFKGTKHNLHVRDGQRGEGSKSGVKYADLGTQSGPVEPMKTNEKYYPGLHVDSEKLPDLKGKPIGEEIDLHVKAVITGVHQRGDKCSYDLDIRKAKVV